MHDLRELQSAVGKDSTMRTAALAALVLLSVFLAASAYDTAFGKGQYDITNVITVEGTGEVSLVPDVASITFTVSESAPTVKAAQDMATKKIDATIEAVKKLGIDKKDVKTLSYNVSPKYEYSQNPCAPGRMCPQIISNNPTIVGYDVSQTIEVKVRNTDTAGETLAALGAIGVQNISGPNFMVDDEDKAKADARAKAIAEAKGKAKVLAGQLGVGLGKVVSYSEGGNYPQPMYAGMAKASSMDVREMSAPSLPTGENKTSVTVSVTYEIH